MLLIIFHIITTGTTTCSISSSSIIIITAAAIIMIMIHIGTCRRHLRGRTSIVSGTVVANREYVSTGGGGSCSSQHPL